MPEIVEVEVHARRLRRWSHRRRVVHAELVDDAAVRRVLSSKPSDASPDPDATLAPLRGHMSGPILRKGKRIAWLFGPPDSGPALLVHLGMTGKWVLREPGEATPRFTRLTLHLDGCALHFVDSRRFGCVVGVSRDRVEAELGQGLGPDALDELPDATGLAAAFGASRRAIKVALMDQTRLAGLGNIHAAESLWRARIHPARPCRDLDPSEWSALVQGIHDQLSGALAYEDDSGDGDFAYVTEGGASPFAVYGRADDACPRCGSAVRKVPMGGRSTFYCPSCQASP